MVNMVEKELEQADDYFPYIGHELNYKKLVRAHLWRWEVGNLFDDDHITPIEDGVRITGDRRTPLFQEATIYGINDQIAISRNPEAVGAIVPRHRSLYDYGIGMPVHGTLVNPELMLMAGSNLFVAVFERTLRLFGAVMFLRDDSVLKRRGLPKAFLSVKRYLEDVLPAYLKQQMFDGVGEKKIKRDIVVYPGQEKNPVTRKRGGGRTKTGKLRDLSPIFFDVFRRLTMENSTSLYITPVNISFSQYPDATFIVHPTKSQGLAHKLRYVHEQNFTGSWYPRYAIRHPDAKLEVIVNYGKPEIFAGENFKAMRDIMRYVRDLKNKIGLLESIFPAILLYRALDERSELPLSELSDCCKRLYDSYSDQGVNLEKVSQPPEKMMPVSELVERAVAALNIHPRYRIIGQKTSEFVTQREGRYISLDPELQRWYANNIRHLDSTSG